MDWSFWDPGTAALKEKHRAKAFNVTSKIKGRLKTNHIHIVNEKLQSWAWHCDLSTQEAKAGGGSLWIARPARATQQHPASK